MINIQLIQNRISCENIRGMIKPVGQDLALMVCKIMHVFSLQGICCQTGHKLPDRTKLCCQTGHKLPDRTYVARQGIHKLPDRTKLYLAKLGISCQRGYMLPDRAYIARKSKYCYNSNPVNFFSNFSFQD